MPNGSGWIAVDLDRTVAVYDKYKGALHIGDPIAPMVERIRVWLSKGVEVRIFTARANPAPYDSQETYKAVIQGIQDWCLTHIGQSLAVTHEKDFDMVELWDDRAISVKPNEGIPQYSINHASRLEHVEEILAEILRNPHPGTAPYVAAHRYLNNGATPDWAPNG